MLSRNLMHVPLSAQLPAAGTGWKWLLCRLQSQLRMQRQALLLVGDFNKTSAVWTVIDAVPEVADSPSPAAGFWRVIPRKLGKGARSHRCVRLLSFNVFFGE